MCGSRGGRLDSRRRSTGTCAPADRRADREALVAATGSLAETLDARRPLRIGRVALCQEISGYGQFEPLDRNEFPAGALPRVLIYTELTDFKTERQPDSLYAVKVVQEVALHKTADGKDTLVWEEHPAQVTDVSRAARRDFFLGQLLRLPAQLTPGDYELRLRVLDLASGVSATATLPIKVTAGK